jgi:hypothetical protein
MTAGDYRQTWIITDDKNKLLEHASPWASRIVSMMNMPDHGNESCRGPCGDRHAMETMYKMAKCKNAVLTFGSSFGSCITSLAGIQRVYRVGRYNDCHLMRTAEPTDVNTHIKLGREIDFFY